MRKALTLFYIAVLSTTTISHACTTFLINQDGQLFFGRNYDWITGSGMVCSNLKGINKTSMKTDDGETINWMSLYGSVTFNQYGREFPTGGMNEKGLVVELMWLDETVYPKKDKRPAIGVLQWIQYQLDNCATIDEVIASDKVVRIASGTTPLHYLVADARGEAATIEFLDGKLVVHRDGELSFPVLTNNIYGLSATAYIAATGKSKGDPVSLGNNSLDRFSQACSMIEQLRTRTVSTANLCDYSFNILDKVSQGDFTKWSIVYDLAKKEIHFRTNLFHDIRTIRFNELELTCGATNLGIDMNQKGMGDVTKQMTPYTLEMNRKLVETSFRESADRIPLSPDRWPKIWNYPFQFICKQ